MSAVMTIQELASAVVRQGVTTEEPYPYGGGGILVRRYEGFEYQARRVARLLRAFGFPAKARRSDPLVNAFKTASRAALEQKLDARWSIDEEE